MPKRRSLGRNSLLYTTIPAVLISLLAGCQPGTDQNAEEADRKAAEAKLEAMMQEKEAHRERISEMHRRDQERAKEAEARRQAEERRRRYAPQRLAYAAKPRKWAAITVPDLNVKAVFNSTWSNDQLSYRVALLGQKAAIDTFLGSHPELRINFADQSGNKIFEFPIQTQEFQWAPANFNQGIPTAQMTGGVPLELPIYESSVQWNLLW